jgi:hypothetical protein
MIQGHLNELRTVVEQAKDLPEATRSKLLQLADQLERDVSSPGGQDTAATPTEASSADAADSIAPAGEGGGVSGLVSAIEGLETSHPEVTAAVSNVARMLSKLGF